jgi:hypothetical protein
MHNILLGFPMKLKNCCANISSALCTISYVLRFLYKWLSSTNPSFHDANEEIDRVQPRCSSFSRAALSWSLSHCDLNLPVFSLAARVLAFSTMLVTSDLEVINRPATCAPGTLPEFTPGFTLPSFCHVGCVQ